MSEPIVRTSGRPMSSHLERALDSIPAGDRRRIAAALREGSSNRYLARLHRALALELYLVDLREQEALRQLAEANRDDDDLPYPPWPAA